MRLQKLTPEMLYRKATAISESGKIVSGTVRRKEERQEAARKGEETKQKKKKRSGPNLPPEEPIGPGIDTPPPEKKGEAIYNALMDLINEYPVPGSRYLRNLLNSEIQRYGIDAVMAALADLPYDVIRMAQEIIYYEDDSQNIHRALKFLADAITGVIMTPEEQAPMMDAINEMDTDYMDLEEYEYAP